MVYTRYEVPNIFMRRAYEFESSFIRCSDDFSRVEVKIGRTQK